MDIQKTNELEFHHIFAIIVGSSGSGKTTLAGTLPDNETLIISAESGLLSLRRKEIDFVKVKSFDDLISIFNKLKNGMKYKHIFIDSITEIGEIVFSHYKPQFDKSKNFALYEAYSETMTRLLKSLRDMDKYNIWLTCLDKLGDKDGSDTVTLDLVQKSLSKKIVSFFDEVFYLTSIDKDGEKKRFISTDNTYIDFAKDRSGALDKFEKPDLGLITNKIFNSKQEG